MARARRVPWGGAGCWVLGAGCWVLSARCGWGMRRSGLTGG
ncbi:MAG TPA: hypothetical protein VFJ16_10035 [Longimicrobium sp.]|nr:hypothetical protein [Longimicrobium sp.]